MNHDPEQLERLIHALIASPNTVNVYGTDFKQYAKEIVELAREIQGNMSVGTKPVTVTSDVAESGAGFKWMAVPARTQSQSDLEYASVILNWLVDANYITPDQFNLLSSLTHKRGA